MIRPPFAARVAAGIAVTVVEEVQKLPSTAVSLPMTAVSQMLQTTMRVQQSVTALAIKGDEALSVLFHTDQEQPTWATFDEDAAPTPANGKATATGNGATSAKPANQGRFELYSMPAGTDADPAAPAATPASPKPEAGTGGAAAAPEIAEYLDYDNLTLAQLRARLRSLSVPELTALLEYENAARSRAPFQTMLGNRITTATAK
ncbi:lipid droplet-associated protein [Rhodococcus tukisamuensis]|uniref:Lipid droplet-associated protein n=1 Tax=Rhodococcus tukisamuensis TaxID=168276 RepID=A0A1G7ASH9_9NOCA|nr:lipid droplet-associated protein [Rhodococcus tukisamuensis]SDE17854.1 hypothetical protein SAMN05444580_111103 [Rhodococcus tukisamuensis]